MVFCRKLKYVLKNKYNIIVSNYIYKYLTWMYKNNISNKIDVIRINILVLFSHQNTYNPTYYKWFCYVVNRDPYEAADFETAINATGFGKFNYVLLLVALIGSLSSSFATTTMSYVIPVAECDLSLTLVDKGMLNGSYYLGEYETIVGKYCKVMIQTWMRTLPSEWSEKIHCHVTGNGNSEG